MDITPERDAYNRGKIAATYTALTPPVHRRCPFPPGTLRDEWERGAATPLPQSRTQGTE